MPLQRLTPFKTTLLGALVFMMLCAAWPAPVQAGCLLSLVVENTGKSPRTKIQAKVKSKGGTWKSLKGTWTPTGTIQPGKRVGDNWKATFKCSA